MWEARAGGSTAPELPHAAAAVTNDYVAARAALGRGGHIAHPAGARAHSFEPELVQKLAREQGVPMNFAINWQCVFSLCYGKTSTCLCWQPSHGHQQHCTQAESTFRMQVSSFCLTVRIITKERKNNKRIVSVWGFPPLFAQTESFIISRFWSKFGLKVVSGFNFLSPCRLNLLWCFSS